MFMVLFWAASMIQYTEKEEKLKRKTTLHLMTSGRIAFFTLTPIIYELGVNNSNIIHRKALYATFSLHWTTKLICFRAVWRYRLYRATYTFRHFIHRRRSPAKPPENHMHMRPVLHCRLRSLHNIINRDRIIMHRLISGKKSLTQSQGRVRQYSPRKKFMILFWVACIIK